MLDRNKLTGKSLPIVFSFSSTFYLTQTSWIYHTNLQCIRCKLECMLNEIMILDSMQISVMSILIQSNYI